MRLDYVDCGYGPAKKATILVGLRKVPETTETPGLAAFFQDVCGAKPGAQKANLSLRLKTEFPKCWANSADMQLLTSDKDCFDAALVITLLDTANHFPIFPVKDSEWAWLLSVIARPEHPLAAADVHAPAPDPNPCAKPAPPPQEIFPKVYGNLLADRLCVAMPEMGCDNECGKTCGAVRALSVGDPKKSCTACFDCEIDEMLYAVLATLLAFNVVQFIYKSCLEKSMQWLFNEGRVHPKTAVSHQVWDSNTYSDLQMPTTHNQGGVHDNYHPNTGYGCAVLSMGIVSFFISVGSYYLLNMIQYLIVVKGQGKEMCVKLFDFQTNLATNSSTWQSWDEGAQIVGFWSWGADRVVDCYNDVCPQRLLGLMICTWLSLWSIFAYWRREWAAKATVMKLQEKSHYMISGAGGGGGGAGGCIVS